MFKTYKAMYIPRSEVHIRNFKDSDAAKFVDFNGELPELLALRFVNQWNRQNITSGFVYWIE